MCERPTERQRNSPTTRTKFRAADDPQRQKVMSAWFERSEGPQRKRLFDCLLIAEWSVILKGFGTVPRFSLV